MNTSNVVINAGQWNLNGHVENITSLTVNNGTMNFSHGTLNVSGSVNLNGGTTVIASNLNLSSGSTFQISGGTNSVGVGGVGQPDRRKFSLGTGVQRAKSVGGDDGRQQFSRPNSTSLAMSASAICREMRVMPAYPS